MGYYGPYTVVWAIELRLHLKKKSSKLYVNLINGAITILD